jgi:hypothetical protein
MLDNITHNSDEKKPSPGVNDNELVGAYYGHGQSQHRIGEAVAIYGDVKKAETYGYVSRG